MYSTSQTGFSWANYRHIFDELPKHLRYEVAKLAHKGVVKTIKFFKDKEPAFVSSVFPFLRPM
jgi:hypothetical protein